MQHINITSAVLDRLVIARTQADALAALTAADILTAQQFANESLAGISEFRREPGSQVYISTDGHIDLDYFVYCQESEFATLLEMDNVDIQSNRAVIRNRLDIHDGLQVNVVIDAPMPLDYHDTLVGMGKIVTQTQEYKSLVC
jgi:hypothetical protein